MSEKLSKLIKEQIEKTENNKITFTEKVIIVNKFKPEFSYSINWMSLDYIMLNDSDLPNSYHLLNMITSESVDLIKNKINEYLLKNGTTKKKRKKNEIDYDDPKLGEIVTDYEGHDD